MTDQEYSDARAWLEIQAQLDASAQRSAHIKARRSGRTFRYDPPEWLRRAISCLDRDDIEGFKAIRLNRTLHPGDRD